MSAISFEQALHGSPGEKGQYLLSLRFTHRNLETVMRRVDRHMTPGAGLPIALVVGPSGVGKTAFATLHTRNVLKRYDVEIREDPDAIPAVLNEVDAADGKEINWRLFYRHLLEDLQALAPDLPIEKGAADNGADSVRGYRLLFERALRFRKVRHLILDEAVHFTDSRTEPLQYGNLLKSLANRAGMNLLLVGAYGSEKLKGASGQLSRRVEVIHFPRYQDNQDDFDAFTQFLKSFEPHIPLPFKIDIKQYIERLFHAHLGMSGYAARTLIKAVTECAFDGSQSWKDEYVWNAMPSPAEYETVALETLEGEKNVKRFLSSDQPVIYPSEANIHAQLTAKSNNRRGGSDEERAQ
jgi:hypothetical protein